MELLSQKTHKPAEKEKGFLLSAKGPVQVYIIHAALQWGRMQNPEKTFAGTEPV